MVNIYKLKFTLLQQEILRLLFIQIGKKLTQRAIAIRLDVSQPAVVKALPELEKENLIIINQDKDSKRWAIELNKNNPKVMELKRIDNLKLLYEIGFAEFIEKEYAGSTIILFGSYAKGEDNINSDIDVAIIGRKDKSLDLNKFEKLLERKIIINFYDSFEKIHKHLKENLCNGIIITGGIEL
jgi:predicted nucleotidyltransferase